MSRHRRATLWVSLSFLIAAMGGRLEVESRPGDGTRFTLFLPGAESRATFSLERKRA